MVRPETLEQAIAPGDENWLAQSQRRQREHRRIVAERPHEVLLGLRARRVRDAGGLDGVDGVVVAAPGHRRGTGFSAVDVHVVDQVLVFLALGGGTVTIPRVTAHVRANLDRCSAFGSDGDRTVVTASPHPAFE